MSYVVGVDPGKKTGVALFHLESRQLTHAWECTTTEYADWLRDFAGGTRHVNSTILFAVERFVISGGTMRKSRGDENWSIELIGLTRHVARWHGHDFKLQDASSAKRFAGNDRLREAGWYMKGKDHANDAVRHVVLGIADSFSIPPPWVA